MSIRSLLRLLFFTTFVFTGCAQSSTKQLMDPSLTTSEEIRLGEKISFYSKTLKEIRSYLVHLPKSYNDESIFPKKYPVLYVLDGESHFEYASGISDFMGAAGVTNNYQIPELIVVAIPNKDPGKDNRFRDYSPTLVRDYYEDSGGGDLFRKFLSDELIPQVESNYRTISLKVLAGHSMGGLLAVYDLLSQPSIFNAYIAMDPSLWWDKRLMLAKAQELKSGTIRSSLYLSTYGKAQRKEESKEFVATLTKKNPFPFRSKFQIFDSETHGSLPIVSLYNGLRFIFEGFRPDLNALVEDPSEIERHFSKFSKNVGVAILPPEDLISLVCNETSKEYPDRAIACFQVNALNYPDSYNARNALAKAFLSNGRKQEAIQSYRRSLELKPNNVNAVNGLEKIGMKSGN